jgi:CHAT domain-containing protein
VKVRLPGVVGRWAGILAILSSLVAVLPGRAAAQDAALLASAERIMRLIADGRNIDAVDTMKTTFEATPPASRQAFFVFAAHMCVALSDVDCAIHFVTHDSVKDMKAADTHPTAIGYRTLLAWYVGLMTGSLRPGEHVFDRGFPVEVINPANAPVLFAEFQLLAARQSRGAHDFEASRDYVDKALASALVLRSERFDAPRLLVRIAGQLLDNYDAERALRLFAAAEPVLQMIPPDSLLNFDLLQLRATLNGYRKDFAAASRDLRLSISLLDRLQLKPDLAAYLKASAYNYLLGTEVLRGDRAAVADLLQSHPLLAIKPEILKRGHFANESEFNFAVAEEFVRFFLNDPSDAGWSELLKMPAKWTTDPERLAEVRAFGQAAVGLALARMHKPDARHEFIEAARMRLSTLQQRYRQSKYSSPLPYWADQLLLEFALASTLSGATPDYELVLGAHIVVTRSIETSPDDVLASQAIQASDERKRLVQALRTIDHQRSAWERARLAALAQRLSSPDTTTSDKAFKQRFDIVYTASDFADQRRRLRAALAEQTGQGDGGLVTSLATLKELLLPDEALVFYVPMFDHTGKICVRADRVVSSLQQLRDSDTTDVRLLRAALTAAHPPSIEADSQYPADAAVRLGKLLFGGLEDCLRSVRRVYHLASGGVLAQIPPGALLTDVPPRLGAGFDLRAARWLVRNYAFIKTSSIDAFVATKKLSKYKRATLDYLGVGDPVLAARTNALASLGELPETSEELQRVGRLFEKSKVRILRRDAASEENFRLQPLSEFDVLHFATHGLVRAEVPGLPEPSLVLTPDPRSNPKGGDAFNDGLLTTSQIAALSLRTRLVILSACNSARYEASIIDSGIQGLSTAFAIAGVPSTIAALWPIESSLTRDLIVATFQAARGDSTMPIADAVATAMRKHLDGPSPRPLLHPRFWSALVVLGDGSMKLGTDQGTQRDLAAFADIDMAKSEEILSATPFDNDFASSTIGPWNGKRSPSLVRRQRLDGTTKWEVSDFEIGAGPTAATDRTIYAAGYITVTPPDSGVSVPVLRQLTPDGRVSWTQRLPSDGSSTMVMALGTTPDRMAVALVGPTLGKSASTNFYVARIDATGAEAGRMDLALASNKSASLSGVLAGDGAARLAIVNHGPMPGDRASRFNGYGVPQICVQGDAADIVLFDVAPLRETGRTRIDRFNAKSALATDDGWLVVGSLRDGCGLDTRAAAFQVRADGAIQEMWRDRSPFVTYAQALRRVGKAFEIVGRSQRSVAVREERSPFTMPDFASLRWGDEGYVSDEVFSVRLSEQGKEERTDFIAAGLPIAPMGMMSTSGRSVIHGTVGSRPLWLSR